ncbi:hypothetical protein NQ314_009211 [Rhamnusium bicolor]|uniref:Kinesin-like protein n=1 Tax=Rhamnusium bicolor TaxID=1586634 RepID=A0AAV8Y200_9CUCU|nr:hypothetical protein NQ314_009211 [Rhamnusium bicolor]
MALSAPDTPKNNFATPRRLGISRTPGLNDKATQNTPRSQFATPKSSYTTPRSKKLESSSDTPDCFSNVTLETPISSSKRRSSKDKIDEVSNLTVAVRIRPMNTRELACVGATDIVRVRDNELIIRTHPNTGAGMSMDHIFQYDHVFWSCDEASPICTTQEDVFMTIGKPLLNSAFRGYNACLFAYGQTGSGKSFSMMGKNMCEIVDIDSERYSGITPRFCRDLFERISCLDIGWVATVEELRDWLLLGNKNRATAATNMNEKSSRSHSIFSIELCLSEGLNQGNSSRSRVSLVDLAGSERLGNSHNSEEKIREGVCINKSLLTLGKVISALADQKKNQFVPYRDSVLTWLLRESLGGNSLTSMLATISPASTHLDETLATLRYACQARSIVNRARVNENPHDRLIRELRSEVERLRALRQDYERNSLSSSSLILIDDSNNEELDELRGKLVETENKLYEAQRRWEQRFMETKECQMKELAKAEKYKAELESTVRIMKNSNNDVNLAPYRTNFLEELEGVLTEENVRFCENDILDNIKNCCYKNGLICTFNTDSLIITDPNNKRQSFLLLKKLNMSGFENISDFLNSLAWTEVKKPVRKLSKAEVMTSMNQIYQALANLQPSDNDNNLSLLFARVNKSLQTFEAALLNNVKNTNSQKNSNF